MKRKFNVVSDGSCDLPGVLAAEKEVEVVPFLVSFDGTRYQREGVDLEVGEFYRRMVAEPNVYPKTAAPSPEDFYEVFKKSGAAGLDIVCVCISTKLSASVQSARIAGEMVEEEYPDIHVTVLDSLATTLMQGVYVLEVCRMRDMGYSAEEAAKKMEELVKTGRILFTVGSLDYLQHGGRIGKVTSIVGTLLDVKPLITLQDGEIHSSGLRRGRKKSLDGVVELLLSYLEGEHCRPEDCGIAIGYCYDYQEAQQFQEKTMKRLREKYGEVETVPIYRIGATIGIHAGPYSIGYGVIRRSDCMAAPPQR